MRRLIIQLLLIYVIAALLILWLVITGESSLDFGMVLFLSPAIYVIARLLIKTLKKKCKNQYSIFHDFRASLRASLYNLNIFSKIIICLVTLILAFAIFAFLYDIIPDEDYATIVFILINIGIIRFFWLIWMKPRQSKSSQGARPDDRIPPEADR